MRSSLVALFGGVLIGAFLVVQDEILTLAMYCAGSCLYPYPFIGAFHLYDAEIIAFAGVLVGIFVFLLACIWNMARTIVLVETVLERREQRRAAKQAEKSGET